MIDRIIIYVEETIPGSNYVNDKKKYEELLNHFNTHDFKTNQLYFLRFRFMKFLKNDVAANKLVVRFNDKDIYFERGGPNHIDVYAILQNGKKHKVTDRWIRYGHSLDKMFIAGEFDSILEER